MSQFKDKVILAIQRIPYGKVASYGQIALIAGSPSGARQVGWILHGTEGNPGLSLPWWRVINNSGRITIKGSMFFTPEYQKELIEAEGIPVSAKLELDIEKYRWRPTKNELRNL